MAVPSAASGLAATPLLTAATLAWTKKNDPSITGWDVRHRRTGQAWGAWTAMSGDPATVLRAYLHDMGPLAELAKNNAALIKLAGEVVDLSTVAKNSTTLVKIAGD